MPCHREAQTETGTAAQPNPSYGYDANGRLAGTGATAGQSYLYDAADNPTRIVRGSVTANQSFDDAQQLTGLKNAANATTGSFTYSLLGERSSWTDTASGFTTSYTYDQASQLTGFTGKDTSGAALSQSYGYDGDGLRRYRQTSTLRTMQTWDPAGGGGLGVVIQDGASSYIYGAEGVPIEQITQAGSVNQLHHDQLGSIRAITAANRSVQGAYSYDPYGKPLTQTGTGANANPFRYAGQYTDPSGLIYLRARTHDPATGQFLTGDPITPTTRSPYAYTAGNPVNATDPSGLILGIPGTPSWKQVGTRVVGFVDGATGGLTDGLHNAIGIRVDECSDDYRIASRVGNVTGVVLLVVGTAGGALEASPYEVRVLEAQRRGGRGLVNLRDTRIAGGDNRIIALDRHPLREGGPSRTHIDLPQRGIRHWPYGR